MVQNNITLTKGETVMRKPRKEKKQKMVVRFIHAFSPEQAQLHREQVAAYDAMVEREKI